MSHGTSAGRLVIGLGAFLAIACAKTIATPSGPTGDAAAVTAVAKGGEGGAPGAVPTAEPSGPVVLVPELAPEVFAPTGTTPTTVFVIEGATMVAEKTRVGRVVGDEIEWMKTSIPKSTPGVADNTIVSIHGRYPDAVGVIYITDQGRAPMPTYYAISGKWASLTAGGGGGAANVDVVRVGETMVMGASSSMDGHRIHTLSGPRLQRRFTPAQGRCKKLPFARGNEQPEEIPAVDPSTFGATPAGTLVSIGGQCAEAIPAAEIWDKTSGKAQIVDLSGWWKHVGWPAHVFPATGDELWASNDSFDPVLRFSEGKFAPLPLTTAPLVNTFASLSGQLYAHTSEGIFRFEEGKWNMVARLAHPIDWRHIVVAADGTFWGGPWDKVFKLREARRVPAEEACKSWFVFLYDASDSNTPKFTYPTTRKALVGFPDSAQIHLVEYGSYPKRLGVTVANKAQGEALTAYLKTTMAEERPRLFCHAPPPTARTIDLNAP